MISTFYLTLILGIVFLWGETYPDQALSLIHQLKSLLRKYIIQREGQREWSQLARIFHKNTVKAGYSSELVDKILEEYREMIIEELGTQFANEILDN